MIAGQQTDGVLGISSLRRESTSHDIYVPQYKLNWI